MEIEFSQMMVLFACVFLGGLVDSIAGGGGLITLPAYYAVGIPAHMALGTNKFANAIGTLTASVRFFKEKQINIKVALIAAAGALVGSPLGAKLAMAIDEKYLNYILLVAVPLIAIMVLRKKDFGEEREQEMPLLRSVLFGMPPMFPVAISMAFELATYGLVSGLLWRRAKHNLPALYAVLLAAMVSGRIVWGIVRFVLAGLTGGSFPFSAFLSGALFTAVPGIVAQLVLIPLLLLIYILFCLIASRKPGGKTVLAIFLLWLASIIAVSCVAIRENVGDKFRTKRRVLEQVFQSEIVIDGDTTTLERLLEDYDDESVIEEGRKTLHISVPSKSIDITVDKKQGELRVNADGRKVSVKASETGDEASVTIRRETDAADSAKTTRGSAARSR